MKKILCILLSCLVVFMTGCGGHNKNIRFGAADIGGMYYEFASAFTQLANKDIEGYTFETKTTAGSVANLRLISDGYIELAIVQADLLSDAYNGTGAFSDKKYQKGYKAVASLYTEGCQIVVRKDSGIGNIDDLINKKVSIGAEESGTEKNAEQILKMSGITDELVTKVNMDYTEAARELEAGEIDAFFCTAGTGTDVIEQLAKQCDIDLISLDDKCVDKMMSAYKLCEKYIIPAGTYTGIDHDVVTIGVKAVLIAEASLSDDLVESVAKTLFNHISDFHYATSLDIMLNPEDAVKGVDIPFHKGAASYYSGHGINVLSE